MNAEFFIARRLALRSRGNFSRTFVVISVISISLGVAIMIIALAVLTGFKNEIREKIAGFSGHILITGFSETRGYEPEPVDRNQPFLAELRTTPGIRHVQEFAGKAGIIKTRDHIQGIVVKGIGRDYDWSFYRSRMIDGSIFSVNGAGKTDEVIVSRKTAQMLNLRTGQDLRVYFLSGTNTLGRKFKISGIYDTGLEEFDKMYILADIRHVQALNGWSDGQVGGFEVFVDRFSDIDRLGAQVYRMTGSELDATTIKMNHQQIFDWLDLQDINVLIILLLIVMVSSATIVSTLLILVLEQTVLVGILKSTGMNNAGIRRLFLYQGTYIAALGLLWGNLSGLSLCLLQKYTGLIRLPVESYYVPVIPIDLNPVNLLAINLGALALCGLVFFAASFVTGKITPVRAIRFD